MLNFLTKKQRERVYKRLLANLHEGEFVASGFTINEEYVRISFNVAYSDHRVVSLHSLPELCLFAPDWNKDHKVYRGVDWFRDMEEDPHDKNHTELKKIIMEICLVMIDDVEKEMKEQIKMYQKQEKRLRKLRIPPLSKYNAPTIKLNKSKRQEIEIKKVKIKN